MSSTELLYARHIATRRHQLDELLPALGYDALLIHSGTPVNRFLDDQAPPFRANPHFVAWLPLPRHTDCALLLRPGRIPVLWYHRPEDFWHLPPEPPEAWWADQFDLRMTADSRAWAKVPEGTGRLAVIGEAHNLPPLEADINPEALLGRLHEQRTVKTAWERHLLQEANRRAVAGHHRAEAAFRAGKSELDIHLDYLSAVRQPEAHLPYASIVALNRHAAVLHYQHQQSEPPAAIRSFLIDAGADRLGYAADITRTYAREGGAFADLITAIDSGQQALVSQARAGMSFVELHRATHRMVAEVLAQAGIVRMATEDMVERGVTRTFFPHGLGHFIGVQVHDVAGHVAPDGTPLPPPSDHPYLRLTRELAPGNVVTIEPGLYFIEPLLDALRRGDAADAVDWKQVEALAPYGGIRIEDNVLVTEGEAVNFTREAFSRHYGH